jgi:hypothetical protein
LNVIAKNEAISISFGANCPLVFAIAIPAFGYISSLRCEDTASIGAKGRIIFLLCHCERRATERGNLLMATAKTK